QFTDCFRGGLQDQARIIDATAASGNCNPVSALDLAGRNGGFQCLANGSGHVSDRVGVELLPDRQQAGIISHQYLLGAAAPAASAWSAEGGARARPSPLLPAPLRPGNRCATSQASSLPRRRVEGSRTPPRWQRSRR